MTLPVVLISAELRIDEYLSLGYLEASLEQVDVDVTTVQWRCTDGVQRVESALDGAPDGALVGITWPYVFSEDHVVEVARWVKARSPASRIVVGGHPVSFDFARVLESYPEIDFVIRGEADDAIVELHRALAAGRGPDDVFGLAWSSSAGVATTEPRPQLDNLDELPFPSRRTLEEVVEHFGGPDRVVVRMIGSRGCYARCEFCSMVAFYALDGVRMAWRRRSPESLVAEMRGLVERFGIRRFWFADDEFIGPPKPGVIRLRRLVELLDQARLDIEFGFDTRANGVAALDADDLLGLHAAGLRVVAMGLESGSQAALKRLNKGMRVATNYDAIDKLRAAEVDHRYGFIMYDQHTSLHDLHDNVQFLRFADPSRICNTGPSRLLNAEFPEMGTPLYKKLNLDALPTGLASHDNFQGLGEEMLGYTFIDEAVGRFRRVIRAVARDAVVPTMIPRPVNEPAFTADTWWTGVNHHPRNRAAMDAFLWCHEYLLDIVEDGDDQALIDDVCGQYRERLSNGLAVLAGATSDPL